MNTWTCKGLLTALATCLALAGCDAWDGLALGKLFNPEPLKSAELAGGAVTLVPPAGFCIDRRNLKADFALMARCDTLDGDSGEDAPFAVITVTAIQLTTDAAVVAADLVTENETILSRETSDSLTLVQVQGDPSIEIANSVYWRAVGQIGSHGIGLAIYSADNRPALGHRAPVLLEQFMQRSQAQKGP